MKEEKTSTAAHVVAPVEGFSLISNDTLFALYRNLLKCRREGAKGKRRKDANTWPFDAAAVALASKLFADDTVIADSHNPVFQLLRGEASKVDHRQTVLNGASGAEFSIQPQIAVGVALAHKTKKTGRIAVVFGSDDAAEAWGDTLEIARTHRLPMVFAWDSGDQETNHGLSRRRRNTHEFEPGSELAQITADGNDVVAMYRVAHEAVERARRDRGPTLIECMPFRFGGSKHRDPIANMESYLRGKGLLRRGLKQELMDELARKSQE